MFMGVEALMLVLSVWLFVPPVQQNPHERPAMWPQQQAYNAPGQSFNDTAGDTERRWHESRF